MKEKILNVLFVLFIIASVAIGIDMVSAEVNIFDRLCVTRPAFGEGESMMPTLKSGELIYFVHSSCREIQRGDIVSVKLESKDGHMAKRIIGMPGDKVYFDGVFYFINDEKYEPKHPYKTNDFLLGGGNYSSSTKMSEPLTLGDEEYFVAGDNWCASHDSRAFGAVKKSEILAIALDNKFE